MCLVLAVSHVVAGHPLVVLANRDEYWDRGSEGPAPRGGDPEVVCGLDARAGGTWLGMNAEGVMVALTNRPGNHDPTRSSRGAIAMTALGARSSDTAAAKAAARAVKDDPNPFSLFAADEHGVVALVWDGPGSLPDVRALGRGLHTLSNLHDVDALEPARVLGAGPEGTVELREGIALDETIARFQALARGHDPVDDARNAICVHDEANRRGTVSSAILAVDDAGRPSRYLAAEGPPCEAPFREIPLPR